MYPCTNGFHQKVDSLRNPVELTMHYFDNLTPLSSTRIPTTNHAGIA